MAGHELKQLALGLSNLDPAVQEWAATEVEALAAAHDGNQRALVAQTPGMVAGLLKVAASNGSTRVAQAAAVQAIADLAMEDSNALLLGNKPGLLQHLPGLLSSKRWDMRLAALSGLAKLAEESSISCRIAAADAAFDTMVKLLRSKDKEVQLLATQLVLYVSHHFYELPGDAAEAQGVTVRAAQGLVPLLSSSSTVSWAAGAMWNLVSAGSSAALSVVVEPNTIARLVTLPGGAYSAERSAQLAAVEAGLVLAQAAKEQPNSRNDLASHPGLVQGLEALLVRELPALLDGKKWLINRAVQLLKQQTTAAAAATQAPTVSSGWTWRQDLEALIRAVIGAVIGVVTRLLLILLLVYLGEWAVSGIADPKVHQLTWVPKSSTLTWLALLGGSKWPCHGNSWCEAKQHMRLALHTLKEQHTSSVASHDDLRFWWHLSASSIYMMRHAAVEFAPVLGLVILAALLLSLKDPRKHLPAFGMFLYELGVSTVLGLPAVVYMLIMW